MSSESSQNNLYLHTRHISVTSAIRNRKNHLSNIWIFDSPKNNRRFTVQGDVAFMHFVLFEGDVSIKHYNPDPSPVMTIVDGKSRQTYLDAIVYRTTGAEEWFEFKRSCDTRPDRMGRARNQLSAQAQAASVEGKKYYVATEVDLIGKEILFDNWLLLCSAITRARNQFLSRETKILDTQLNIHRSLTVGALLENTDADAGLMLAVIAKALQLGAIHTDLKGTLFGRNSVIARGSV